MRAHCGTGGPKVDLSSVFNPTDLAFLHLHPLLSWIGVILNTCLKKGGYHTPVLQSQKGSSKSEGSIALAMVMVFVGWIILLVVVAILFATRPR